MQLKWTLQDLRAERHDEYCENENAKVFPTIRILFNIQLNFVEQSILETLSENWNQNFPID